MGALVRNMGIAVLAVALSAALWFIITAEQNPPRTELFEEPIPVRIVNVPLGYDIFGRVDPIQVRVTAPADVWDRMAVGNFTATIDLQGAGEGLQDFTPQVTTNDGRIRIINFTPQTLPVRLEESLVREVPVQIEIKDAPALGFTAGSPEISLETAVVRGPRSQVEQVAYVDASVDLAERRLDFDQSVLLVARNGQGNELGSVTIEPARSNVNIGIIQQIFYRTVPLALALEGPPPDGYEILGISVNPSVVTVVGSEEDLAAIDSLKTKPVIVTTSQSSVVTVTEVALPEGVSLAGDPRVSVRIEIEPVQGERAFEIVPIVTGIPAGAKVELSVLRVNVVISGAVSDLAEVDPTEITVSIDVDDLQAGARQLAPQVSVPSDVRLARISPDLISVTVTILPTPTPTPTPTSTPAPTATLTPNPTSAPAAGA